MATPAEVLMDLEHEVTSGPELPKIDPGQPLRSAREDWVRYFERRYLAAILAAHGGNVSAAARAARIDRVHFYRLLGRSGLRHRAVPVLATIEPKK